MLQLQEVSKALGSFRLQKLDLTLPDGYIMGLIGPNGSGKTTLLHLILGLYSPDSGTVTFDSKNYPESERSIKEELGAVLQENLFFDTMTLFENAGHFGKFYKNYDQKLFLSYLERFHLKPDCYHNRLSKGEQLKFQFAFALSHKPKLLILDEPTANFDPDFRDDFLRLIKSYVADGTKSVILATHLTDDLDRIADYITYLSHGVPIACCDIETLKERYRLVTGESYKIRLLPKDCIIHMEENRYASRALIRHKRRFRYDSALDVSIPTLEEIMFFITKKENNRSLYRQYDND